MKFVRLFKVDFRGPTDHRGARVVVTDTYYDDKRVLAYDYACGNIFTQAIAFLKTHGMEVEAISETKDSYYLAVGDFDYRIAAINNDRTYAVTNQGSFDITNETK